MVREHPLQKLVADSWLFGAQLVLVLLDDAPVLIEDERRGALEKRLQDGGTAKRATGRRQMIGDQRHVGVDHQIQGSTPWRRIAASAIFTRSPTSSPKKSFGQLTMFPYSSTLSSSMVDRPDSTSQT